MTTSFSRRSLLASASSAAMIASLPERARPRASSKPFPSRRERRPRAPRFRPRPAISTSTFSARASPRRRTGRVRRSATAMSRLTACSRNGSARAGPFRDDSTYGVDNRATLDGVAQLGGSARAVVVVDAEIADAELKRMADERAVGIRVNFVTPQCGEPPPPNGCRTDWQRRSRRSAGTFRST